jgi:hypothetical protein
MFASSAATSRARCPVRIEAQGRCSSRCSCGKHRSAGARRHALRSRQPPWLRSAPSRCAVRCSASTTSTTCSPRLRLRSSTASLRPRSPQLCRLCRPADKRGQVVQLGNITVLYDCYNSSPKALMAAVDTLAAMPARRRIVVAGEMLELGRYRRATASRVRTLHTLAGSKANSTSCSA